MGEKVVFLPSDEAQEEVRVAERTLSETPSGPSHERGRQTQQSWLQWVCKQQKLKRQSCTVRAENLGNLSTARTTLRRYNIPMALPTRRMKQYLDCLMRVYVIALQESPWPWYVNSILRNSEDARHVATCWWHATCISMRASALGPAPEDLVSREECSKAPVGIGFVGRAACTVSKTGRQLHPRAQGPAVYCMRA